jgi:hypothetical protein
MNIGDHTLSFVSIPQSLGSPRAWTFESFHLDLPSFVADKTFVAIDSCDSDSGFRIHMGHPSCV